MACGHQPTEPTSAPVIGKITAPRGPGFNQTFWNEFVHDSFDSPGMLEPLRRLTAAPRLYVQTTDEAGQAVDDFTMQTVEEAMRGVATTWAGGRFGLAGVERGTGTREGQSGWLTVEWLGDDAGAICGRSVVGVDGGWMQLNYLHASCGCDGSKIAPKTARHELGHAFGYYHTDSNADVMWGQATCVDLMPSPREVYHATVAYQSPIGSLDSTRDSAGRPSVSFRRPTGVRVIVD